MLTTSDSNDQLHSTATGRYETKSPTPKELDDLSYGAGEDSPAHLAAGETLIYSHADGDFDSLELGIDGIEVTRQGDGSLHAQAYIHLDFAFLAQIREDQGNLHLDTVHSVDLWLDEHRDEIAAAVSASVPGAQMDGDDDNGWGDRRLLVQLTPEGGSAPEGNAGIIDLARNSETVKRVVGALNDGGDEVPFWQKINRNLAVKNS